MTPESAVVVFVLALVVGGYCAMGVGTARGAQFDGVSFEQLPQSDRRAFIKAAISAREGRLHNFLYHLTENSANYGTRDGEKVETFGKDTHVLYRKGPKLRRDTERFTVEGTSRGKYVLTWDGSRGKSITWRAGRDYAGGIITDKEFRHFQERGYNHILGLRVPMVGSTSMSLGEWVQWAEKREDLRLEVSLVHEDGAPLIALKALEGEGPQVRLTTQTYYFDPERGFMPVRYEYRYESQGAYSKQMLRVTRGRQVDGVWVPTEVIQRNGTSAEPSLETELVYTIARFERGVVKDADFDVIEYPPGSEVFDEIVGIAYRILPNGQRKLLPSLDPHTGEVMNPQVTSVEEAAGMPPVSPTPAPASVPLAAPNTTAQGSAESPTPGAPGKTGGLWLWPGISLLLVGLVLVVIGWRSLRKGVRRDQSG